MIYTVEIKANDPSRYVPPTWRRDIPDGTLLSDYLHALEDREDVTVGKVFNEKGKRVEW